MKLFAISVLSLVVMTAGYTDINDNINVEEVFKDPSKLKFHINCYLDRGPCTQEINAYKKHFFEVIDDGCRECNDKERHLFRLFIKGLKEHLPEEYESFKKKYDPNGRHFDATVSIVQKY